MAFGNATFTDIGSAFSALMQGDATASADKITAQGDFAEAAMYNNAAAFTAQSTKVQAAQSERQSILAQGTTENEIAAYGFENSGSALDIIRSNAQQGGMHTALVNEQGEYTAQMYTEEAQAAEAAGQAELALASKAKSNSFFSAGISGVAALATLL